MSDGTASGGYEGTIAFVTGAASGIGKALTQALVGRGAHVVVADMNAAGAAAVAGAHGPAAEAVTLDVSDATAVRSAIEQTVEQHGRLDYLFNNAGIGGGGPVETLPLALWDRVIDVDLRSVVHGVAAAYPVMVRQGSGHIVNTASLAGLVPSPFLTPYAAAKAGVVGLSVSLRVEAAAHGVRVSVVCPGPIETPMLDRSNPPDVPGLPPTPVNARKLLTNALGTPYDPDDLAEDVLAGVSQNQAIIVAPQSARDAWGFFRSSPEDLLAMMGDRATASALRRTVEDAPEPTAP